MRSRMRSTLMEEVAEFPGFAGRVVDLEEVRAQKVDGKMIGEAQIITAVFGEPDTGKAVGNDEVQVIDKGAFRAAKIISEPDQVRPFYLDHGDAHMPSRAGFPDSRKLIGKADEWNEVDEGLKFRGQYNLRTELGRDSFEQLRFAPEIARFSFRWPAVGGEVLARGDDRYTHVTAFSDLMEVSQLSFGSQMGTRVIPESIAVRAASVDESGWDGNAAMTAASSSNDPATAFRAICAGRRNGPPDQRDSWALPHHKTPGDPPNRAGVNSAIQRLPQTQGLINRQAAQAHLEAHQRGFPNSSSRASAEEVAIWLEDPGFGAAVAELVEDGFRHALHGDKIPAQPSMGIVREWLKDDSFRKSVVSELRKNKDLVILFRALATEAETTEEVSDFYETWVNRLNGREAEKWAERRAAISAS